MTLRSIFKKKALLHACLPGVDQWHHHQNSWWEMGVMVALNATRMSKVYEQWLLSLPRYHYIRGMVLKGACFTFLGCVILSYLSECCRMPSQGFFLFLVFLKFLPCSSLYLSPAFALMPCLRSTPTLSFSALHTLNLSPLRLIHN